MPKQTDFETSSDGERRHWDALFDAARQADLTELPRFAELRNACRTQLFRELGYTFWNQEFVDALATRMQVETRGRWVELAAGTGRLTAELARRGVHIAATDDYSQAPERVRGCQRAIAYGEWVGCCSAHDTLVAFSPEAVVCAWPPLGSCLVPDLLSGCLPGSERVRVVLCIGDPGGATEAPAHAQELPPGWALESWSECARWLLGFNDPVDEIGSHSRLLVYRRAEDRRGQGSNGA